MTGIMDYDSVLLYSVGKIPFVVISHVVVFPPFQVWLSPMKILFNMVSSVDGIVNVFVHQFFRISMLVFLCHVMIEGCYLLQTSLFEYIPHGKEYSSLTISWSNALASSKSTVSVNSCIFTSPFSMTTLFFCGCSPQAICRGASVLLPCFSARKDSSLGSHRLLEILSSVFIALLSKRYTRSVIIKLLCKDTSFMTNCQRERLFFLIFFLNSYKITKFNFRKLPKDGLKAVSTQGFRYLRNLNC